MRTKISKHMACGIKIRYEITTVHDLDSLI